MIEINRLKNPKIIDNPFPLMSFDNFLTDEENDDIYNSITKLDNFDEIKWGGRGQIRKGTKKYKSLLNQNKIINNINLFFNNREVFEFFLNKFEKKGQFNIDNSNIIKNFKQKYQKNFVEKIKNKFLKNHEISYLEMDFSQATRGYFREPHHDKSSRIISFLLYFNDLDSGDGGALEIFKYKNQPDVLLPQPKISDLIKVKTFVPKAKQLIVFLSNPISIHGVNKLITNKKRVFAYGSYTLNKSVNWKSIV